MEMLEVDGMKIPATVLDIGTRVKWTHRNPDGWPGPGIARVTNYDPVRPYFAPPVGSGNPGHAYEIELEHNKLRVWIDPSVIDPHPEDES